MKSSEYLRELAYRIETLQVDARELAQKAFELFEESPNEPGAHVLAEIREFISGERTLSPSELAAAFRKMAEEPE